jgi:hypothetical protein
MPIDLYSTIKKTSQWAFGSPVLNAILGSSVFVALTVALIMVVIIMVMYPAKSGTPFSIVVKMFIYMAASTLLIIFLHDGVLKYMMEEEQESESSESFMRNTTMEGRLSDPSYGSTYQMVNPGSSSSAAVGGAPAMAPTAHTAPMPVPLQTPYAEPVNIGGTLPAIYAPKTGGNLFA